MTDMMKDAIFLTLDRGQGKTTAIVNDIRKEYGNVPHVLILCGHRIEPLFYRLSDDFHVAGLLVGENSRKGVIDTKKTRYFLISAKKRSEAGWRGARGAHIYVDDAEEFDDWTEWFVPLAPCGEVRLVTASPGPTLEQIERSWQPLAKLVTKRPTRRI